MAEWFASLPKWRTVSEDQPVKAAAVKPKPEPEPVEDEPAEQLEAAEIRPGKLFGVSSEELARMRAKQDDEARRKQANMRAWRG